MYVQQSLSLFHRFECRDVGPTHAPLPHARRLMRQLSLIVGVLLHVVNSFRDEFSMSNAITSQLVRHNFPRLTFVNH